MKEFFIEKLFDRRVINAAILFPIVMFLLFMIFKTYQAQQAVINNDLTHLNATLEKHTIILEKLDMSIQNQSKVMEKTNLIIELLSRRIK